MYHTIVALVENKSGTLNRIVSLFRKRAINIDSLTVGKTENPEISRLTMVVDNDRVNVEKLIKFLDKLINVIEVEDITYSRMVSRDLAVVKVNATVENRAEVIQLVEAFRARIIDVDLNSLIIEITGTKEKIDRFIHVMEQIGILELARSGAVAMRRGQESVETYEEYPQVALEHAVATAF